MTFNQPWRGERDGENERYVVTGPDLNHPVHRSKRDPDDSVDPSFPYGYGHNMHTSDGRSLTDPRGRGRDDLDALAARIYSRE